MRILIVKLSSLGDVVHAMPVVHDIAAAHAGAVIDWVVEPAFAPLVRRVRHVSVAIECALRRWSTSWWTSTTRSEWGAFRERLQQQRYDAVLDLQGLTKSAIVARMAHGVSYGLGNRTDGAGYEPPARWLVDHAIRIEPHIHAVDRSRVLAGQALGHRVEGPPVFGLTSHSVDMSSGQVVSSQTGSTEASASESRASEPRQAEGRPMLAFVHGTSRDDKLWPEESWIELGQRAVEQGWRIVLPHAGAVELGRAQRIAAALGDGARVWPPMSLDALVDWLGATQGVIGVDSGLSHIATALNLPHVQIYNWPTSWRTGPQPEHGHAYQVSVEARPTPTVDAVWNAWTTVNDVRESVAA